MAGWPGLLVSESWPAAGGRLLAGSELLLHIS